MSAKQAKRPRFARAKDTNRDGSPTPQRACEVCLAYLNARQAVGLLRLPAQPP
jgi:hypothetical protein